MLMLTGGCLRTAELWAKEKEVLLIQKLIAFRHLAVQRLGSRQLLSGRTNASGRRSWKARFGWRCLSGFIIFHDGGTSEGTSLGNIVSRRDPPFPENSGRYSPREQHLCHPCVLPMVLCRPSVPPTKEIASAPGPPDASATRARAPR